MEEKYLVQNNTKMKINLWRLNDNAYNSYVFSNYSLY